MSSDLLRLIVQDWPIDRDELWSDLQLLKRLKVDMTGWPTTKSEFEKQLTELLDRGEIAIDRDQISPIFKPPAVAPAKSTQQSLFLES